MYFKGCTSLRTILIPSSVKTIGNSCFTNCTSLENIQLDGVEEIGELAFAGCSVLGKIIFPESLKTLGAMAFKNCSHLEFVHFPDELLDVAPQMFVGCLHLNDIEVSEQAVFGKSVFLRALSADNWECFERRNGHCRRKLVNVMEYDPDGVFDLLPEGGAGLAELLPQRTLYVTLDAIWEYTQFDEEAYAFQIRILAVCMKIARCLTGSQMAALMSVVWHLRGLLLIWHIRHETSIEKVFPDALSATLNAVGGNGSNRIHNDALVRETFKLFLGSASDELKTAITSQIDHVLGIEGDFSRESPYDVRYTAGMGKPDYWIFSDVMGYLTRNKLGVHIPIPEVHSDDIEDWCAAWSRSLSDYHQNVILFELPPAKDEEENRHAVSVVSPEQVSMLLDVFREVGYHGCFVWTDGARMPFYLLDFIE